jgi:hypothetical protein
MRFLVVLRRRGVPPGRRYGLDRRAYLLLLDPCLPLAQEAP